MTWCQQINPHGQTVFKFNIWKLKIKIATIIDDDRFPRNIVPLNLIHYLGGYATHWK